MTFESFPLIVSPSLPPCLVPIAITPVVTPTAAEGRVPAGGDGGLPLVCTPVHPLNLPQELRSYSVPVEAQRSGVLCSRSHRLQEQYWNPTWRFPEFPILGSLWADRGKI